MSVRKQLSILLALAAASAAAFVAYSSYLGSNAAVSQSESRDRQTTVEVAPVRMATLRRTVEAVGTTRARNSVEIKPVTSGAVVEMSFTPGQTVEAGALLARLDDDIQRADFIEAKAILAERQQTMTRMRQLRQRNTVAKTTLEQAVSALAIAEAAVVRTKRRLEDRSIRAPFRGVVGLTDVEVGALVDDQTMLTRLDNLVEVEVAFSLPERLFGAIELDREVTAQSSAFPDRRFTGRISAIDSRVDPVGRAFKVRASIPNPEGLLPAGMFMAIVVTLAETRELVVPEEAIVVQAADTYVFVADDGKASRRSVVTGQRKDGMIAIKSGLSEGQQVVIRGLQRVRDGGAINILGEPTAGGGPASKAPS